MPKAVAIDLGATSARFALGDESGFQVVKQIPHTPLEWNGHEVWDIELLLGFCREALAIAQKNGATSIGIDTWGVDHGFLNSDGELVQPPVCYRDASHSKAFSQWESERKWLYAQTGIQHQPFNTLYQLLARKEESPHLFEPGNQWLLLPDLLLHLLGADRGYERSIASTTQLTGFDGEWNADVFARFELPLPPQLVESARRAGNVGGVELVRVAGHDTACAVEGMEPGDAVFANIGTWALVGMVRNEPDFSDWAESHNLTNERTVDGRVRLLTNIPGFFLLERLRSEIVAHVPMATWLSQANLQVKTRIDTFDPNLFAPESMHQALAEHAGSDFPEDDWAGILLLSLADAIADRARLLQGKSIVMAGGGSRSDVLRNLVQESAGIPVKLAEAESTIVGNLRVQRAIMGAS